MKLLRCNNIFNSVSAGYSSVMMAVKMKEWFPDHNIINVMANPSKERPESLEFMNECDKYFGLNLVWIEAVINDESGVGTGFKVVDYENLKRKGEIFERGIIKYGIPCKINKWCTRELKNIPLKKYADSIFGVNNYSISLGIRYDEIDRISKNYKTNNIFYPLFDQKITTRERNRFWNEQPIQIKIPAYKGNCDACFEKSKRKLLTIIKEEPETVIWWNEMEKKYSTMPKEGAELYNQYIENGGIFFNRGNESIQQLIEESKLPFRTATDEYFYENDLFDQESDCGKFCVIFE